MPRAFAIVGRRASSSPTFALDDFPGTSGRLDVLCRCVRAALLAGARTISVGPVSLPSDDVVAVVSNELERAEAAARTRS